MLWLVNGDLIMNKKPSNYYQLKTVKYLVIHQTSTTTSQDITMEDITKWHRYRGFKKAGYHWLIRRDGTIEDCRMPREIGAHCKGYNHESIGIAIAGGIDPDGQPEDNFEAIQIDALLQLIPLLKYFYPRAVVIGHRELTPIKDGEPCKCPQLDLDGLREVLNERKENI
jgi:N-acetylmuramoyl-L-alanine amidase